MIGRRSYPLMVVFALGAALLFVRLYEVQLFEHSVWQTEAARLVHSGREIPYRRGRILDTNGTVLARDRDTHHLVLVYREFRRGHPLGQVTHARSLLESRAVPLAEGVRALHAWTRELVSLSPAALEAYARGAELRTSSLVLPASESTRGRGRRVADVGFYARRLLDLERRERRRLDKLARQRDEERSFLELAAEVRGVPTEEVWTHIESHLVRSMAQLERLAALLVWPEPTDGEVPPSLPIARLVHEVERTRCWVENATAAMLFAEATGFPPGLVDPATLLETVDLTWLGRILAWDEARLAEWCRAARAGWRGSWRDGYVLPRLAWLTVVDPTRRAGPDEFVSTLAAVHGSADALTLALAGAPVDWRDPAPLAVFDRLGELFETRPARRLRLAGTSVLPFQDPLLREAVPFGAAQWSLVDAVGRFGEPQGARIAELIASGSPAAVNEGIYPLIRDVVDRWDLVFQAALFDVLREIQAESDPDELSPEGRLLIARELRDRAAERAEFLLKDYGMRPSPLLRAAPEYDVIYLLTRYEEEMPGFQARQGRRREYRILPEDATRPASALVGHVSAVGVGDLLGQREQSLELRRLKGLPERSDQEELELERLIGEVLLHDEVKGVAGVEGYWNDELVGRNGYREVHGLEDGAGGGRQSLLEVVDGEDVVLTIDVELQRAARRTMQHPVAVPADERFDWDWHANPVGAALLLSIEGDVLAAASEPNDSSRLSPNSRGQRAIRIDRTLRKPTFQPPGSVFKPFVAAYALSEVRLDPQNIVLCGPVDGGSGYKNVRCHARYGHGDVALDQALIVSCNAYFAWLGETLEEKDLRSLADTFGFGRPTGVRTPPPWDPGLRRRRGLLERTAGIDSRALTDLDRRLAGNGLGAVEVTPMQLGRAIIALATGELRDLRLVRQIGQRHLPYAQRAPLGLREASLQRVRDALVAVAADSEGTAHGALSIDELGFAVAVKTGSADLVGRKAGGGRSVVRKHTWVAGWVPAEDPVAVFVVFMHDTQATSSHGAVYLARQLLLQPEFLTWLAGSGVDVSEVRAR